MKPRHRRLALVAAGLTLASAGVTLALGAFRSNLVFFVTPTQIATAGQTTSPWRPIATKAAQSGHHGRSAASSPPQIVSFMRVLPPRPARPAASAPAPGARR